jgi:hypothetical protein
VQKRLLLDPEVEEKCLGENLLIQSKRSFSMKVLALVLACVSLVSCGSKEDIKTIADALRDDGSEPEKSAEKGEVSISDANKKLQEKITGEWEFYSMNCIGKKASFEFASDGSCYLSSEYGERYKCSWSWIAEAQMKLCVGDSCRTDMKMGYNDSKSMLTIQTDKCFTEYKRPKL